MDTSVDMKIKILKKSMETFKIWLDSCDQLVQELPQELGKTDPSQLKSMPLNFSHLRDLALKYKVQQEEGGLES